MLSFATNIRHFAQSTWEAYLETDRDDGRRL
jgi:hypothetical protein